MFGVNGQPYISLDQEIDLTVMKDLHDEICLALATAGDDIIVHSEQKGLSRGDIALDLYDHRYKQTADDDLTEEDRALVESRLTLEQRRRFMMIKYGVYLPWACCVQLMGNANFSEQWHLKHTSDAKYILDKIKVLFPKTLVFAKGLPFFSDVGRITIFGLYPNNHVSAHRDNSPSVWKHDDELVMVSPVVNKPLYVYDADARIKHYIDCHVSVFDDLDFHGVEPSTTFTYTLRIDGQYTPEWREKIRFGRSRRSDDKVPTSSRHV